MGFFKKSLDKYYKKYNRYEHAVCIPAEVGNGVHAGLYFLLETHVQLN